MIRKLAFAIVGVAAAATILLLAGKPHSPRAVLSGADAAPALPPFDAKDPEDAKSAHEAFVARNATSPDPKVQDRVGAAGMRLGYLAARSKDLPAARAAFLAAARTKGTGASGAFGTVGDQAAYQAVVCLVAEGKQDEAREGFESLLRERPLSPLSQAAYRRLARLNGGDSRPEWDKLYQSAIAKQEANARFETSVCGPKCLAKITGGDYKVLAKLCGTTDSGTTVEGMRKGLRALGRESWAARMNRRDLAKAKLPAVLFEGDHYVLLQKVEGDAATVWDPRFAATRAWRLPPQDDPDFSATLILLARPEGL